MTDERVWWLWMQQAFPPGSPKPAQLHRQYAGGVREFLEGGPKLWNLRRDLTDRDAEALRDFGPAQAEARLEYAQKLGWQVVAYSSPKYPPLLREIPDPPCVLYVRGHLPDLSRQPAMAVAGARKAGPQTAELARKIGYDLSLAGVCVVSGGALGVDCAALTGAMLTPGSGAVSVLPVSLDSTYLGKNSAFRRQLLEHDGALVSEYFSLPAPVPGTFQVRNRLITGMARGVVLIQAGLGSGTLLYAGLAAAQNREVFVVPGPEDDPGFAGSRRLLAEGALPVTDGEEVLAGLGREPAPVSSRPREEQPPVLHDPGRPDPLPPLPADLPPDWGEVLTALGAEILTLEDTARRTGRTPGEVLGILTDLELEGLAESLPGKRFRRSRPDR